MNKNEAHIAQLAAAMDKLANAINNMTDFAKAAKQENPEWAKMPAAIIELNRRLMVLCTRL